MSLAPAAMEFCQLLRYYRDRSGLSCNETARIIGVDPSYVSRLERGEREPPRRPICERMADALRLDLADTDRLLVAAGFVPASVAVLGRWDHALQEVAEVLTDGTLTEPDLASFRQVIHLIAAQWMPRRPRTNGETPHVHA